MSEVKFTGCITPVCTGNRVVYREGETPKIYLPGDLLRDFDAQLLRADTAEAELADMRHWRDLALQFDNHRMTALGHLRAVVRCSDRDLLTDAEEFLKSPPLSAHEVVAKLAAAEQRIALMSKLLKHCIPVCRFKNSHTERDLIADIDAALNPNHEAESQ